MAASRLSAGEIRQRIRSFIPGPQGEELVQTFNAMNADMVKLKAWADATSSTLDTVVARVNAIATDLNAFGTKLNADAVENNAKTAFPLTLDTNYKTNYATDLANGAGTPDI